MRIRLAVALFLVNVCVLMAQPFPEYAGQDALYSFEVPALSEAPEGYSVAFVEHYGRHGSRYAYDDFFYTDLMEALKKGEKGGSLTPRGEALLVDFSAHYDHYMRNVGNLSEVGWRQQEEIAKTMVRSFPEAFAGAGAYAYACASASTRSIMSMAGFCTGLQGAAPALDVYAEQGKGTLNATNPRDSRNPDYVRRQETVWPYSESVDDFQNRKIDCHVVLGRLFKDVDAVIGAKKAPSFLRNFYVLALGMNSLREDERTNFSGIFTLDDLKALDEAQNYRSAYEWWLYVPRCAGVTEDIIRDAEERLAEGRGGVTARFGHDHVILPVLMMMGVNQYAGEPTTPDRCNEIFDVADTPMASNLQLVFYTAPDAPVLVKVLLNGVEGSFCIPAVSGPYYRWDEVRALFERRLARFPVQ